MANILISEIFGPTIQGEGVLSGVPSVFIRTGGCDFRCLWCDSLYAVLPKHKGDWIKMTSHEVLEEVERISPPPIVLTLTGGNPALQDFSKFIPDARLLGYRIACETQGSKSKDWFAQLDYLVLSPKPPSSGEKFNPDDLHRCIFLANFYADISIKVVIFNDEDYLFAKDVAIQFPKVQMYLSVGNPKVTGEPDIPELLARLTWLSERVLDDRWTTVIVRPQQHVLTWGNQRAV